MSFNKVIAALVAAGLTVTGCASNTPVDKEVAGAGIGTLAGALLAYGLSRGHSDKEVAMVVGAFLGGVAGSQIGARLSEADKVLAGRNLNESLEYDRIGSSREWVNPDSGNSGYSTPTRTFDAQDGSPCREFTTVVSVGGKEEQAYGTACRQADGSWKIQP